MKHASICIDNAFHRHLLPRELNDIFAQICFSIPLSAPGSLSLSFFSLCVSICACVSTPQFKRLHVGNHEYVYFCVQSPMHLLVCAPPTYLGLWVLKPFSHSVSTDLSSVLTQRVLVPSALFSELSQGVKQ